MMNIFKCTFLNVGTGDSIILEWIKDSKKKIAIIDCNNHKVKNRKNPVSEYLDYFDFDGPREIDFLVLTHPHVDHFSGFIDLFEHCKKKKIKIRKIYHTLTYSKEYLTNRGFNSDHSTIKKLKEISRPVTGIADEAGSWKNKLDKLIKQIQKDKDIEGKDIKRKAYEFTLEDDEDRPITLNDKLKLSILAPSYDDIFKFIENPEDFAECGVSCVQNHSDGNILSTVFAIESEKWYILLTSDVKKIVFQRVLQDGRFESLFEKKIELLQVPHHGSLYSHIPEQWKFKFSNSSVGVISVGDNNYGLPHADVKNYFEKENIRFYTTEKGIKIHYDVLKKDCLIDAAGLLLRDKTEDYRESFMPDGTNLHFIFNANGLTDNDPYNNTSLLVNQ